MESPLGKAIGNSLEVAESLACLRGEGPKELRELVVVEGAMLLVSANIVSSLENGKKKIPIQEEVFDPPPKYCEEEPPPSYEEALKIEIV